MQALPLLIACLLAGCTAESLVRDNVVPDCRPGGTGSAKTRAAACMTAAAYEVAVQKAKASGDEGSAGADGEWDNRTAVFYKQARARYEQVIAAHLAGGPCPGRTERVLAAQRELAALVSQLAPSAGEQLLLFAVTADSVDQVRRLLAAGAPRSGDQGSLLHAAARFAQGPVLEALQQSGIGLEDRQDAGASPLFVAVNDRPDNVQWLLAHGADVNATDSAGAPVIRHALVCANTAVVEMLVAAGARIDDETRALAQSKGLSLR